MLLGKQYTRIRRRLNARIDVTFEDDEGNRITMPRKLKMLICVGFKAGAYRNKKAIAKEEQKFYERRKSKKTPPNER